MKLEVSLKKLKQKSKNNPKNLKQIQYRSKRFALNLKAWKFLLPKSLEISLTISKHRIFLNSLLKNFTKKVY